VSRLLILALWAVACFGQITSIPGNTGGGAVTGGRYSLGYNFDGAGSALTTQTRYAQVPFGCVIIAWNIIVDTGTATVKVYRKATGGTTLPAGGDSINTSGVSISSGNVIRSTTLTDFTSLTISAGDVLGFAITSVASATTLHFNLECTQ